MTMEILQLVRARGRRWRVADTRAYESCELVTLIPAASTRESARRLLTPFDDVVPIPSVERPRRVSRRRWQRACRALIAADGPPGSLQRAAAARFDVHSYQLQPAMAVLHGAGSRVLLADEVGLGKTVQAGIMLAELLARGRADRVLVLTPAGLRDQWAVELAERFGIESSVASAAGLRQIARSIGLDANPWETARVTIASIDYVKRPEVLPAVARCRWDVLVVDEAHAAVGESERHEAIRLLGARASYVLLLTATPHSGDPRSFDALRDVGASGPDDRLLVFRRRRAAVDGGPGRRTHLLHVRPRVAERRMLTALARYHDAVRRERSADALALSVLHKRAFSSAWSLAESVDRRLQLLDSTFGCSDPDEQLQLPFDVDGETNAEDEPPAWPAHLTLSDRAAEKRLLTGLAQRARLASGDESKVRALVRLLRRAREPVLVFTEYRDTALHVSRRLGGVPVLHGGLDRHARRAVVEGFTTGTHPVLVATDAGGQGLNLHQRCRLVVNLELPWSPARLEQRIGRVDRIGQSRRVHAVLLVGRDTGEAGVLSRLERRIATADASMASAEPRGDSISDSSTGLTVDAHAEAARLLTARKLTVSDGSTALTALDGGQWWTTRAQGKTRRRLGGRGLRIYRARLIDGAGGIAASHLITLAQLPSVGIARDHPVLRDAVTEWSAASAGVDAVFWRTRIKREEWILASVESGGLPAYQPGLFDRRTERRRASDRASREAFRDVVEARLAEARQRSTILRCDVDLVLAIQP